MRRITYTLAVWTLALTLAVSIGFATNLTPASAQEPVSAPESPDWGDYPLLMSQFGELCTMCVAFLYCTPDDEPTSDESRFALYYFQTKDFWGQIATIWDYFARTFDPVTSESRPVTIYLKLDPDSEATVEETEAYLDKVEAIIEVGGTLVDRDTAVWHDASDSAIGTCVRPSVTQGLQLIEQYAPWTDITGASQP